MICFLQYLNNCVCKRPKAVFLWIMSLSLNVGVLLVTLRVTQQW